MPSLLCTLSWLSSCVVTPCSALSAGSRAHIMVSVAFFVRVQRGNRGVQKYQFYSLGCRRTRQDQTTMAALLSKHSR